ncbi:MAG: hypothetical protein PHP17_07360 [Candidatus Omnitrophica bacterium]|nr:hypothetical protein [Candidatus Omnitrophota bacterium]
MKKTEKIRYEIDPHNRLAYAKTGKDSQVPMFRTVLDGNFEIDENNCVTYHVKKSQASDTPQQIKLKGAWSLDKEHNLVLTLDKWGNQIAGNKLTLESELIDAKDNRLSFSLASKDSAGNKHIYILNLGGRWQADKYNRLSFNITKENGPSGLPAGKGGKLTLRGAWEINKQNEIIYTYDKSSTITLKGCWDITEKHRIKYILNKEIKSEFDFKVSVGKKAVRGLQYEIGIGAATGKKTITLFGQWNINPRIGLLFEMPCEEGKVNRLIFGARGKLDKNLNIEMRLENKSGEDLGIDVKLSRSILEGKGEAFIRALKSRKEVSIAAGIGFRW